MCQDLEEEHKNKWDSVSNPVELLSYLGGNILHLSVFDLLAWLCECLQVTYTNVFEYLVALSQTCG